MSVTDPLLFAAIFLEQHPGWSWHDLETAPVALIDAMHLIHLRQTEVANKRTRTKG